MKLKIREIKAKSILNPSKLGCDYANNPYRRLYLFILKNLPSQLRKFKMAENPEYQKKLELGKIEI